MRNILVLSFYIISCLVISGQNVAKGKKYSLSETPNYPHSAKNNISSILTDGIMQKTISPLFWKNGRSLGWMGKNNIEIEIDLEKKTDVVGVSLNTANGEDANAYYPKNIFVFASSNKKEYKYLGNLMNQINHSTFNEKRSVTNLTLENVNVNSRYFKFIIFPQKNYFFVDEIQITRGEFAKAKTYQTTTSDKLPVFIENIVQSEKHVNSIRKAKSWDTHLQRGLIIEHIEVASMLTGRDAPCGSSGILVSTSLGMVNEAIISVLRIANNTENEKQITFSHKLKNEQGTSQIFIAGGVTNSKIVDNFDALIATKSPSTIKLLPQEMKYIVLKTKYNAPGVYKQEILFNEPKEKEVSFVLNYKVVQNTSKRLNGNNWPYFSYPQISNVKSAALNDLADHGINTFTIPRDILAHAVNEKARFREYLSGIPKSSNILLFFNFAKIDAARIGDNNAPYLSLLWKQNFQNYLKMLYVELNKLGYSNIYIFPYDEIDKDNFDNFTNLVNWLRKDLKYKCFVTILSSPMLIAGNHVDIAQINRKLLSDKQFNQIKSEKWIYEVMDYARDRAPIEYRRFGWEAYYYDLKGVGFWNYSQTNNTQNRIDTKYLNGRNDYSVIYNDNEGNIIPSLRWEAFYLGIQDYYFLKKMEKSKGKEWTDSFVKDVLNNFDEDKLSSALSIMMEIL